MLGNVHDAEDLAQETFVKGYSQIRELRSASQFGPWVARIARNQCVDFLRRKKRGRDIRALNAASHPSGSVEDDPEREDLQEVNRARLEAALARLPGKYRVPLVLYYFNGHSTESVARTLDLEPAAVLTRLCRARKELRRILGQGEHR